MNFLLEASYGETVLEALGIFAIGILTVFGVLVMIWGVLALFSLFSRKAPKKIEAPKAEPVQAAAPAAASNDEEIVAVIAAAIAMAESESGGTKFRVVSFKRK